MDSRTAGLQDSRIFTNNFKERFIPSMLLYNKQRIWGPFQWDTLSKQIQIQTERTVKNDNRLAEVKTLMQCWRWNTLNIHAPNIYMKHRIQWVEFWSHLLKRTVTKSWTNKVQVLPFFFQKPHDITSRILDKIILH